MDLAELNKAFGRFKSGVVTSATDLAIGLANTSYLLTTSTGERYVLRLLRLQAPENARAAARIQAFLNSGGVTSPQYVQTKDGDVVGRLGRHNFTLSAYLEGRRAEEPTLPLARSFGEMLAKMHERLAEQQALIKPNRGQWLRLDIARREIAQCPEELRNLLSPHLETSRVMLERDLPQSIIHADLVIDNTFVRDDRITAVFDFETAEYTARLLDIARTYLSLTWRRSLDAHKLKEELFNGYNASASAPLTPAEQANFPQALVYVAAACAAWLQNNNGEEFVKPYLMAAGIV